MLDPLHEQRMLLKVPASAEVEMSQMRHDLQSPPTPRTTHRPVALAKAGVADGCDEGQVLLEGLHLRRHGGKDKDKEHGHDPNVLASGSGVVVGSQDKQTTP